MSAQPTTFKEVFDFYYQYAKLLYTSVQSSNHLPLQTLFELNAALDHIARHWHYGDDESAVVEKAYSHFKRSCLDIFKLKVKETVDQFNELKRVDTSIIDNGKFDQEMRDLIHQIKEGAADARRREGHPDAKDGAFDLWAPIYEKCLDFEKRFYRHGSLDWAKRRQAKRAVTQRLVDIGIGIFASLVAGAIWWFFTKP